MRLADDGARVLASCLLARTVTEQLAGKPYAKRMKAQSTYDALRLGAAADPQAAAIRILS